MDKIFMFPGQGSQTIGMAKDIYQEFKEVKLVFQEASDTLGFSMEKLCFEDSEGKLNLTEFTQPAILTVSTSILKAINERVDIKPTAVAGHSLGEYSALVGIGALAFSDALKAVHFRGQAMQRAVPVGVGAMAAYLGNNGTEVEAICKEISKPQQIVEVVNFNSPGQLVLSGHKAGVEKACEIISEKKLGKAKALPVSAPFHSTLMQPAADEMREHLQDIQLNQFTTEIVANVDAKIHLANSYSKDILVKQIAHPVLWTQTLKTLNSKYADALWIEIGPGKVLQGLAKKTLENSQCFGTSDLDSLLNMIQNLS
ncbi:ACP S-malonyltransferase [Pigmentibacter sp. JX0631]|uniref:ACP S-malonyltransferase n=1 Tax=Pigmentibacter sp. JX0631 TaxID=2976982 RepID=UPI0024686D87|nr:ACP S-malonyltransferase [Pigmentibacter sp. JX0631]WGL58955.1 ACP S-malonyltransferase [Pigmentibacter sp. JX0631]